MMLTSASAAVCTDVVFHLRDVDIAAIDENCLRIGEHGEHYVYALITHQLGDITVSVDNTLSTLSGAEIVTAPNGRRFVIGYDQTGIYCAGLFT